MCTQQSRRPHSVTCTGCSAVTQEALLKVLSSAVILFFFFFLSSSQDFLIMFLHHLATISLITFSYVNNMARVGTLVMCLHDAADVLIEVRMCETTNSGSGQMVCEKGDNGGIDITWRKGPDSCFFLSRGSDQNYNSNA